MKLDVEYELLVLNLKEVLSTSAGRNVLWHILDNAGIYASSFTGNSQTFFNEGRRNLGLYILSLMEDADPTCYPRMVLDNVKKLQSEEDNGG